MKRIFKVFVELDGKSEYVRKHPIVMEGVGSGGQRLNLTVDEASRLAGALIGAVNEAIDKGRSKNE